MRRNGLRTVAVLALWSLAACPTKSNPNYSDGAGSSGESESNSTSSGTSTSSTATTADSSTTSPPSTTATETASGSTGAPQARCDEEPDGVCFGDPITYGTDGTVGDIDVADVDGDGDPDVVVAIENRDAIQLFLAGEQGDLQEQVELYDLANRARSVAVADLDADGLLDIAASATPDTGNDYSGVTIRYGTAPGQFDDRIDITVGVNAYSIVAGDFGGDDSIDLVVGDRTNSLLTPLIQVDGAFQEGASTPFGGSANRMASGDFDGDGRDEVAVADNSGSSAVGIVRFDASGAIVAISTVDDDGATHFGIAVHDIDSDGDLDIASTRAISPGSALVAYNEGGAFSDADRVDLQLMPEPNGIAAGDVNGDGIVDLVVAENGEDVTETPGFAVFVGDGSGGFSLVTIPLQPELRPRSIELADINGDGLDDIVCATEGNRLVLIRTEPS